MSIPKYLSHYSPKLIAQVQQLIDRNALGDFLRERHPKPHQITNDHDLREYVSALKTRYLKQSAPLSKVMYDNKLHVVNNALGLHTYVSRVQGAKLKSKNEIRVSSAFKHTSEALLNMIVVHELAHLKEKAHDKAFYRLCLHMLPDYHQLEFEMRLYLIQYEQQGSLYTVT
jgi:UTP pyrophosphatase